MDGPQSQSILELTIRVDAPRERVYQALTEPTALTQWWGPDGFTTQVVALDLRVGGGYRLAMQPPDGELFHLSGEFVDVVPPSRLAYTFRWEEPDPDDQETVVKLVLESVGDVTKVSLWQGYFATGARLALHKNGWTESFKKLRALAARPS